MKLEGGEMLVSLNDVMRKFTREEQKNAPLKNKDLKMRRMPALSVRSELLAMWENDYPNLKSVLKSAEKKGKKVGEKKTETS